MTETYIPIVRDPIISLMTTQAGNKTPVTDEERALACQALDLLLLDTRKRIYAPGERVPMKISFMLIDDQTTPVRIRFLECLYGTNFDYTPRNSQILERVRSILLQLHSCLMQSHRLGLPILLRGIIEIGDLSQHETFRLEALNLQACPAD